MTHLRIEQNNGVIEEVSSSIITKLYEIAHAGLDVSSNLQGRLHTTIAYKHEVEYLQTHYPDLYINADTYAIVFEDPNMLSYLLSLGIGSNGTITEDDATAATIVANSANTTVTKFNELKYFTSITESKGGWTGTSEGYTRFTGWTALEEVDISNFTSLGHVNGYGWGDTFSGCTSLETVTASSKLIKIGHNAFQNCTNLETITGLDGEITLANFAFKNCSSLSDASIQDVLFKFAVDGNTKCGQEAFYNTRFTHIHLSPSNTHLPQSAFEKNTALQSVDGASTATYIGNWCFQDCSSLTSVDIDWSNITDHIVPQNCFCRCTSLSSMDLTGAVRIRQDAFNGCTALTTVTLSNTLTTIDDMAFRDSGLEELTIPSSVTNLGGFNNVTNLRVVRCQMQRQDTTYWQTGLKMFSLTSDALTTLELPEGVFEVISIGIKDRVTGNLSMNVPASILNIWTRYPSANTVTFAQNSSLKHICGTSQYQELEAFDWTQDLTSTIKNRINNSCQFCFKTVVNFPKNNLKFIPGSFFADNSAFTGTLDDIIPDNVIAIGTSAFYRMGNLSYQIVLPSTIRYIGPRAFEETKPTSFKILATTPPEIEARSFDSGWNNSSGCDIYVPSASVQAYKEAPVWTNYASRIFAIPT